MDPARLLLVNGALVLAAGVLCGLPFFLAIVLSWPPDRIRAWRVAHATLVADGLLLLVAALLVPILALGPAGRNWMATSLAVSGWAFVVALGGGAWTGERGLVPWPVGRATFFFAWHALGAAGALVGVALLVAGLLR